MVQARSRLGVGSNPQEEWPGCSAVHLPSAGGGQWPVRKNMEKLQQGIPQHWGGGDTQQSLFPEKAKHKLEGAHAGFPYPTALNTLPVSLAKGGAYFKSTTLAPYHTSAGGQSSLHVLLWQL